MGYQRTRPSTSTVFDLGSSGSPDNRRDTFLAYDAWGDDAGESFASFQYAGSGNNYTYTRTYDNTYQYDALGRRTTETTVHRNGVTATVVFVLRRFGNAIQESTTPAGGATVVTQYVMSAAAPGMIVLRDDTDPNTNTLRRVWSFQGIDRSTLALYQAGSGYGQIEQILYTPTGLATFVDPSNNNGSSPYKFTDLGGFEWRYLWHGGRAVLDQDFGIYDTGTVVDRQSGLLYLNGSVYDSTSGTPLLQDKYAFFRPSTASGELPVNANQYSSRGSLNTQFPLGGSEPTWNDTFWSAFWQSGTGEGLAALANPFGYGGYGGNGGYQFSDQQLNQTWGENFLGSFLSSSSYGTASNVTQPAWITTTSTISAYVSTAAFTAASFGAYAGALGLAEGAITFAGVGAVGAGIGGAYTYANGGRALSGALNGAIFATNIGAISPELSALAFEQTAKAGIASAFEATAGAESQVFARSWRGQP